MTVTSRVQSQSHEALALAPALRCGWVTAEGGREGGRPRAHEPHSSLERGHHCAVVGSARARRRNAPAGLRSLHSGSRSAWGDTVGGDTRGGRVRKWGRGSRERAAAAAGWQTAEVWETPGRSGAGGPPGPPRRRWRRKKVTTAPCSAPTATTGSGGEPGPGCGPRGVGRPGARAPEFAEDPGARREWSKVLSPPSGTPRWNSELGVSEWELVGSDGAAGPELLGAGKRDEVGWARVRAGSLGSHPARGTEAGSLDECAEPDGAHLCSEG